MTKDISGGHVFFTYLQPLNPCEYSIPSSTALHGVITETGHKAAAVLHAALSLCLFVEGEGSSVNSLLFSIGIQWISDVFVSGYRNSIQLHTDIYLFPFGFFFAYR